MMQDVYIIDDDDSSIVIFRELFRNDPEYKFTSVKTEQIDIALKNASSKNKIRFDYIDTLLTDWHKKDLRTVDEVNTYLQSLKEKDTRAKQVQKVAFEYTQSTFDNLESLYEN